MCFVQDSGVYSLSAHRFFGLGLRGLRDLSSGFQMVARTIDILEPITV